MHSHSKTLLLVTLVLATACGGISEEDLSSRSDDGGTGPADVAEEVSSLPDLSVGEELSIPDSASDSPSELHGSSEVVDAIEVVDAVADATTDLGDELVEVASELPALCAPGDPCDDSDPCTLADECDGLGGCSGTPVDCDDGEPCTDGDFCLDGECFAGEGVCECLANEDCAGDEDGDLCNGTLFCNTDEFPHQCAVDPSTISTCSAQPPVECNVWGCVPATGECILIPTADGAECDDENPCTTKDECTGGSCAGLPLPSICPAGETFCAGASVCLCDACGNSCQEVLEVCDGPAFFCEAGECVACEPGCQPEQCGDDGCGGSCGTCPGTSTCSPQGECVCGCPDWGDLVCDPATGTTYPSACKAACAGVDETQLGGCGAVCYTSPDAVPADEGLPVAHFSCKDANMNSPGFGGQVSSDTLKETVWIAYFGACT